MITLSPTLPASTEDIASVYSLIRLIQDPVRSKTYLDALVEKQNEAKKAIEDADVATQEAQKVLDANKELEQLVERKKFELSQADLALSKRRSELNTIDNSLVEKAKVLADKDNSLSIKEKSLDKREADLDSRETSIKVQQDKINDLQKEVTDRLSKLKSVMG